MASSGKRKTTMAKLNRERKLRERRLDKQAKKEARKQAAADHANEPSDGLSRNASASDGPDAAPVNLEPVVPTLPDA
jgi:hypothetical protein